MKQLSYDTIKQSVLKKGYFWREDIPMIVGIRTNNNLPNVFNDYIVLCIGNKNKFFKGWMGTTEPGTYWLEKPMNNLGTAVLQPNQYVNCWRIGYHGSGLNKHEALVQCNSITVYRDNNKDLIPEKTQRLTKGLFGINIHSTGILNWIAKNIDKWSAGCQVFASYNSFKEFMFLLKESKETFFSYTLLEENDIL